MAASSRQPWRMPPTRFLPSLIQAAGTLPSLSTSITSVMVMGWSSRAPSVVLMLRARVQQFCTSLLGKSCSTVGRTLAPAQAISETRVAARILRMSFLSGAHRFEGLGQLRECVRVALLARQFLALLEGLARVVGLAHGLQQHAEHQIRRQVVGDAADQLLQLGGRGGHVAFRPLFQRQSVSRKAIVRRGGDELPTLRPTVHAPGGSYPTSPGTPV